MKHLIVLVVASASLLAQAQSKQSGNIRGVVTDQTGSPVAGATVYAVAQGLTLDDAIPRSVKTDNNGVFDFRGGLDLGAYKLYARKDSAGYPNPFDSFYADAKSNAPKIDLTHEHPSGNVTLKLGPQAAVIAGRIVDANTRVPLKANLSFEDSEGHGHEVEVDGSYRIQVPPGKNVTLMVFLPPPSDRSLIAGPPLKLDPGQYVYLEIPVSAQ